MKALLTLGCLLIASLVQAADTQLHWSPYVFLVSGQIADVVITRHNVAQGCTEANRGAFGSSQPTTARLVAVKAIGVVPAVVLTAIFQKTGHQQAARITAVVGGSVGVGAAAYNLTVNCGR